MGPLKLLMKKITFALLVVLALGLFGCGSDDYYNEDYDSYYYGDYDTYDYDYDYDSYDSYDYDDNYNSGSDTGYYDGCESLVILGSTPNGYTLVGTNDCGEVVTVYVDDYYDWRSGYGTDGYGNFVEFIYW